MIPHNGDDDFDKQVRRQVKERRKIQVLAYEKPKALMDAGDKAAFEFRKRVKRALPSMTKLSRAGARGKDELMLLLKTEAFGCEITQETLLYASDAIKNHTLAAKKIIELEDGGDVPDDFLEFSRLDAYDSYSKAISVCREAMGIADDKDDFHGFLEQMIDLMATKANLCYEIRGQRTMSNRQLLDAAKTASEFAICYRNRHTMLDEEDLPHSEKDETGRKYSDWEAGLREKLIPINEKLKQSFRSLEQPFAEANASRAIAYDSYRLYCLKRESLSREEMLSLLKNSFEEGLNSGLTFYKNLDGSRKKADRARQTLRDSVRSWEKMIDEGLTIDENQRYREMAYTALNCSTSVLTNSRDDEVRDRYDTLRMARIAGAIYSAKPENEQWRQRSMDNYRKVLICIQEKPEDEINDRLIKTLRGELQELQSVAQALV